MLVLSRYRDETIMIGDSIEITVVDIRGDKVRLGITAPKDVAVHRKEIYEAIKRENRQAAELRMYSIPYHAKTTADAKLVPEHGAIRDIEHNHYVDINTVNQAGGLDAYIRAGNWRQKK